MSGTQRPVDRDDPQFQPFWEGTEAGELRVQKCGNCGTLRWPPRPMCAKCQSSDTLWVPVAPRGTLFSWVGVGHQTVAGMPAPYVVGLVELANGIRMLGQVIDVAPEALAIGMPLRVLFQPSPAGVTLANWTADGDAP